MFDPDQTPASKISPSPLTSVPVEDSPGSMVAGASIAMLNNQRVYHLCLAKGGIIGYPPIHI